MFDILQNYVREEDDVIIVDKAKLPFYCCIYDICIALECAKDYFKSNAK